jgi:hypothetical protein
MRRTSLAAVVTIATVAGGCRDLAVVAPELPPSAEPLSPLAVYDDWWRATQECSGRSGALARVSWFVVRGGDSFAYRGVRYDGYWWNGVHWITLAESRVQDPGIVRHEMLHDLLGRGDHPAEFFQERCRTVVVCNEDCRADSR